MLDWMVANDEAVDEMGKNGRQFVLAHFNRDALAADMLTIVRRTAAGESFVMPDRDWEGSPDVVSADDSSAPVAASGDSRH